MFGVIRQDLAATAKPLAFALLLSLSGCGLDSNVETKGRYQAISNSAGIFVLDTTTGQVRYCVHHEGSKPVSMFTNREISEDNPFASIAAQGPPDPARLVCHEEFTGLSPAAQALLERAREKRKAKEDEQ